MKCHIDVFRIQDKVWIRCAWNGVFKEFKVGITTLCPSCNRPIKVDNDYLNPKTREVTEVWYEKWGTWAMIPPEK